MQHAGCTPKELETCEPPRLLGSVILRCSVCRYVRESQQLNVAVGGSYKPEHTEMTLSNMQGQQLATHPSANTQMARLAVRVPPHRQTALHIQAVLSPCGSLCSQHLRGVCSGCWGLGPVWARLAPLLRLHASPCCQAGCRCA